jgi:hypothetical protein
MTAVTKQYGPAMQAFLILPLVSAFFVDLANAVIIAVPGADSARSRPGVFEVPSQRSVCLPKGVTSRG